MCGIVGYIGSKPVLPILLDGLALAIPAGPPTEGLPRSMRTRTRVPMARLPLSIMVLSKITHR